MRFIVDFLFALLIGAAHADGLAVPIGVPSIGGSAAMAFAPATAGAGCSTYTTVANAKLDGSQNVSAMQTLLCTGIDSTTYNALDFLYVFAASSQANALQNLALGATTTYTPNLTATVNFSVNNGLTGDGVTGRINTGWTPSGSTNFTLNNASFGGCLLNSRTTSQNYVLMGGNDSSGYVYIQPLLSGVYNIGLNASNATATNANAQGSWMVTRSTSTTITIYKNGSSIATPSLASSALAGNVIRILAYNDNGTTDDYSKDQVAYAFAGANLTGTQISTLYNALHNYLVSIGTTLGTSGC